MKTNRLDNSSRRTKIAYTAVFAPLAIVIVGIVFMVLFGEEKPSHKSNDDYSDSFKTSVTVDKKDASLSGLPDNSKSITSDQVKDSNELVVNIDSVTQTNGIVSATATVNNSGSCVFLFQPNDGGKPVTKETGVIDGVCSVSISENSFAYIGKWNLKVTLYYGDKKAEITKDVEIK